jgi:hypothetical protein
MVKLNLKKRGTQKIKKLNTLAKKVKRKMKSKKNRKKRISFKKMSKRKLAKTIKKAKKKIQRQLKKLVMKGGSDITYNEIPRDANETPDSMEASAGTAMVANDADQLNVLEPTVKEGMFGMFGGNKLPKSLKNKRTTTMKRLKKLKKKVYK